LLPQLVSYSAFLGSNRIFTLHVIEERPKTKPRKFLLECVVNQKRDRDLGRELPDLL
jgi:hypothetical protein